MLSLGLYGQHVDVGSEAEQQERLTQILSAASTAAAPGNDWLYEFKVLVGKDAQEVKLWVTVQEETPGKLLATIMRPEDY